MNIRNIGIVKKIICIFIWMSICLPIITYKSCSSCANVPLTDEVSEESSLQKENDDGNITKSDEIKNVAKSEEIFVYHGYQYLFTLPPTAYYYDTNTSSYQLKDQQDNNMNFSDIERLIYFICFIMILMSSVMMCLPQYGLSKENGRNSLILSGLFAIVGISYFGILESYTTSFYLEYEETNIGGDFIYLGFLLCIAVIYVFLRTQKANTPIKIIEYKNNLDKFISWLTWIGVILNITIKIILYTFLTYLFLSSDDPLFDTLLLVVFGICPNIFVQLAYFTFHKKLHYIVRESQSTKDLIWLLLPTIIIFTPVLIVILLILSE